MSKRIRFVGILVIGMVMGLLSGCTPEKEAKPFYQVEVRTEGGQPVANATVQVYEIEGETLMATASTDGTGVARFALEDGAYVVRIQDLPAGHHAADAYQLRETSLQITVQTKLLTGSDRNKITTLGVGDVMFDFDVTLANGEKLNLSQVLAEKKLAMVNFWFANCGYCTWEFPAIKQAYLQYSRDVEVIALSPYDSSETIQQYQGRHGLPFPMANCHASWPMAFGVSGYPTTVLIDRYGVICAIHVGAVPDEAVWANVFAHFTTEDYTQKLFDSLTDVG